MEKKQKNNMCNNWATLWGEALFPLKTFSAKCPRVPAGVCPVSAGTEDNEAQ